MNKPQFRAYRPSQSDTKYFHGISVEEHITTEIVKKLLDHVVNPQLMPDEMLEEIVTKASLIAKSIVSKSA
jgi:hypothetical protein